MNPKWNLFDRLDREIPLSQDDVPKSELNLVLDLITRGILEKRRPKGSRKFKIFVSNRELFNLVLETEFPDGLESVFFESESRESAAKRSRDSKGTSVSVDSSLLVKVFSSTSNPQKNLVDMTDQHGVAGLDLNVTEFIANGLWASVENHETFFACSGKNCPDLDGVVLLSGNPSKIKIDWMEKSCNHGCNFIHFGDLDFFGLEHFAALYERIGKGVTFWNDVQIDSDFYINKGDKALFSKQKLEANLDKIRAVLPHDINAKMVFKNITDTGLCIHQEMIQDIFFKSNGG